MGQGDSRILKEPWGRFDNFNEWSDEGHRILTQEIAAFIASRYSSLKKINIGFVGQIKAGKTSFLSTIASIDKGRLSQVASIGEIDTSVTRTLRVVPLRKALNGITLYDTAGFHIGGGLKIEHVEKLIQGNLQENFKFVNANGEPEEYRNDHTPQDRMNCMVIVMDINNIAQTNVGDKERSTIGNIIETTREHGIPVFAILTKVDRLCDKVKEDVTNTYKSVAVQDAVSEAQELFGIPRLNIFPVQNYANNLKTDRNMEILTLLALRTMVHFADDYLSNDDD